jgi:nucleotide-binding universal stress UspA family protein
MTKLMVVAGVAFDETANPLWEKAEALLRVPGTEVRLCHVVGRGALKAETNETSLVDDALKKLFAWTLAKLGGDAKNPLGPQLHLEVAIGNPADEIVQFAVDNAADLVLVGTHARKGVAKLILGSVAEQVLHRSPCAVLIARTVDFDGRAKTPEVAPAPDASHKPFHPHAPRYHSSVVFSGYDANLFPTGISRKDVR